MITHILLIIGLTICTTPLLQAENITLSEVSNDLTSASLNVILDTNEAIIQDSVIFSTNNPMVTVQSWKSSVAPHMKFDQLANMPRQVYTGTMTFYIVLQSTENTPNGLILFMHYLTTHHQSPQERQFVLTPAISTRSVEEPFQATAKNSATQAAPAAHRYRKDGMPTDNHVPSLLEQGYESLHTLVTMMKTYFTKFTKGLSELFTASSSLPLQILIAFLLGMLMSLTPCIYPMIPITVGLLGASSSNSWTRNFLLAMCYTLGMATTFALLGLITVLFGAQCGKLLCNPWFIVLLISFLAYCGGSMLGLYEFYTPRFLQPSVQHKQGGRLVSAFFFGIISGTFASPCMSPGLALILSAAATLGNNVLGFMLLFAFGIGVSMPLLIIGTFSGALNVLPRAGMWMNDVKKAFGFLLIMMCFYYAQSLIPVFMAWLGAALFAIICGTLYATNIRYTKSLVGALVVIIISTTLVTTGFFAAYRGLIVWHVAKLAPKENYVIWNKNYDIARAQAQAEHKFILADFTATWCPMCVLLDKQILQHPDTAIIFDKIIPVKIDGSSNRDVQFNELTKRFNILGIPQLLLIDPMSEAVIHIWGSELLGSPAAQFRDEFLAKIQ
jgi:thiol:disulfide interchange protein DsbD